MTNNRAAITYFEASLKLAEACGDIRAEIYARLRKGLCEYRERKRTYEAIRQLFEESIDKFRELGDVHNLRWAVERLGNIAKLHGDLEMAKEMLEEGLLINTEIGDKVGSAWAIFQLGTLAETRSDLTNARILYEECLTLFNDHVGKRGSAWALLGLGNVAIDQREFTKAQGFYSKCLQYFETLGETSGVSHTLIGLATVERERGDLAQAHTHLKCCLFLAQEEPESLAVTEALCELAAIFTADQQLDVAVKLYAAASTVQSRLNNMLHPQDKERIERALSEARSTLGDDRYRECWEQGKGLTWQDAIEIDLAPFPQDSDSPAPVPN